MTLTWDQFLVHSMTQQFMVALRDKLISDSTYFLHKTRPEFVSKIAKLGLKPQRVYGAVMPAWVKNGGMSENVLFVTSSLSSKPMNVTGETVPLAFSPEWLPSHVGLDWTFPDSLSVAANDFNRLSDVEPIQFTIDQMIEHSTILCYDPVPPSALRRWDGVASIDEPMSWPALL